MSFSIVIPARFQSSRLPGKPLLDIAGKPMIQHVYEAALKSDAARVIIATDSTDIETVAKSFSAEVCMTSESHPSGTDRLQEVVSKLAFNDDHIIVNVQGDEPLIEPALINQVATNLANNNWASIATLYEPVSSAEELFNPNNVKLVENENGEVLYFSRAPIPWVRDNIKQFSSYSYELAGNILEQTKFKRHIGIYAYRCAFLNQYVRWPAAPLEQVEKLEQLRAMYYGHRIHVDQACSTTGPGVDTMEDLEKIRSLFSND